jgi:hypothetical protein
MKSFGLFLGFTMLAVGGCLPQNFLADLTSNVTTNITTTIVNAILAAVLSAVGLG